MSSLAIAGLTDDFESYAVGGLPGGSWEDARHYVDGSTHTGDSVSVIETEDAFGNQTQAVQILDHVGTSGGLVSQIGPANVHRMEVDVRLDQFANGNVPNWMSAVGFYQEVEGRDLNGMPQAMVYASRNGRFQLFVHNANGQASGEDIYGLRNLRWNLHTWYRIAIEADTLNGIFNVQITDIESGELLRDVTREIDDWDPQYGQYNLISMNDGEYGDPLGTVANMATFDNVNYVPAPASIGLLGLGALCQRRRRH
jgi:hypothetical protein